MHKILVVIEPLLIDEDYYARVEVSMGLCNGCEGAGWAHCQMHVVFVPLVLSLPQCKVARAEQLHQLNSAQAGAAAPALLSASRSSCAGGCLWWARQCWSPGITSFLHNVHLPTLCIFLPGP